MDLDPEILKQLYETFSVELEEQAQTITSSLLFIEKKDVAAKEVESAIDAMFRAAHTIKGAANSISFTDVAKIAHSLESIFSKVKNKEFNISHSLVDVCFKSVDAMKILTVNYVNNVESGVDSDDIIRLLESYQDEINQNTQVKNVVDSQPAIASTQANEDSLRVDVKQLDKLSSMLDELNLSQITIAESSKSFNQVVALNNQLAQTWKQLMREVNRGLGSELPQSLDKLNQKAQDLLVNQTALIDSHSKRLRNQSHEMAIQDEILQDQFRMLRLVPASVLFCTMPRLVRDISHDLNKSVELTIKGDDVKVDRMVLQAVKDPVIHLLRNAIDHGIEDTAVRLCSGKDAIGKIEIEIMDRGSQIAIVIKDDGAGLNFKSIKETALAKNLISSDAELTIGDAELTTMLFSPGFSTKKEVTSLSGRGVGLDVVKSNLEKIKGTVEVASVSSEGTRFTLLVPLTLSSERGLLVKAGDQVFAIPTIAVDRILRIKKQELIDVAGRQAVIVDHHTYPAYLLASILELAYAEMVDSDYLSAVVIKKNELGLLLLVDEIVGEREIVVKQIQSPLSNIPCVTGGTLADGNQVVIVLNPHELVKKATKLLATNRISFSGTKQHAEDRPSILVVDDSITTRTLEKNILESKNYSVSVAVNGKEAWDYIQKKHFSLIITDVNMPIMDGFELTEKVKQHEKFKNIPVIIVTSLDSDAEKRRGLEVGANAYIVKGEFESGALVEIVTQLV